MVARVPAGSWAIAFISKCKRQAGEFTALINRRASAHEARKLVSTGERGSTARIIPSSTATKETSRIISTAREKASS